MKKTGLNGYIYEFSVDYNNYSATDSSKFIPDIPKYLMVKYNIK